MLRLTYYSITMTNTQKIIKFIINAINDIQQTLDAGNYQAGQYTDIARGMVRGVSLSIQRVAEQFDGQSDKELSGLCTWGQYPSYAGLST